MPLAEQDQDEADRASRVRAKPATAMHRERDVGDERFAEPDQRARDEGADGRRQAVEEVVEVAGEVRLDVEDREAEHEDEARRAAGLPTAARRRRRPAVAAQGSCVQTTAVSAADDPLAVQLPVDLLR